ITVRSVLDMHSGIPGDMPNGLFTVGGPYPRYRYLLLRVLRRGVPERPVNTPWAYSNSGYVLLQNLVGHMTRPDFDAYPREHLFAPMGMSSTRFDDASVPLPHCRVGIRWSPAQVVRCGRTSARASTSTPGPPGRWCRRRRTWPPI